jgi:hypothetical protein
MQGTRLSAGNWRIGQGAGQLVGVSLKELEVHARNHEQDRVSWESRKEGNSLARCKGS